MLCGAFLIILFLISIFQLCYQPKILSSVQQCSAVLYFVSDIPSIAFFFLQDLFLFLVFFSNSRCSCAIVFSFYISYLLLFFTALIFDFKQACSIYLLFLWLIWYEIYLVVPWLWYSDLVRLDRPGSLKPRCLIFCDENKRKRFLFFRHCCNKKQTNCIHNKFEYHNLYQHTYPSLH